MSKLQSALELAALGYHVFPLETNSKLPHIDAFPERASRDPAQIKSWWTDPVMGFEQDWNIGISTSRFGDDQALVVIDVDNKGGKNGDESLIQLQLEEGPLPDTAVAHTPTGGRHYIFCVARALRQSAGALGPGLDTRSRGGYVVASGSTVPAGTYTWASDRRTPSDAPLWLVERFGMGDAAVPVPVGLGTAEAVSDSVGSAVDRATLYLQGLEPAIEGERNHQAYIVAARLKDFGVSMTDCFALMSEHWPCSPPLDPHELDHVIRSAFKYGTSAPASAAPETQFTPVFTNREQSSIVNSGDTAHPFERLNREFAFVLAGGGSHILWETTDAAERTDLVHLNMTAFHQKFASWTMQVGKKNQPVTEEWMRHPSRRSFDGLCFRPGLTAPKRFYNLWRGFAVEPKPGSHPAVDMFLEHCYKNICNGNDGLFKWLIGYFAHMIQKPWEKPLVALVFRGGKGVGKSAVVERIGYLLGRHFLSTSNRRFLVGNFNGHLENCLFFVLEEAFWSGDKQAEGVLKDLITGNTHVIEHKGEKVYTVDNRTRVAIVGNEDWLVPASHDERRYAVFDVGEARKQDRDFFQTMREGLERGGYGHLLAYFQAVDLAGLDFNAAPLTQGLQDQKEESLDPVLAWWLECLQEGRIVGSDFDESWPNEVDVGRFRAAYQRYAKERNIRSWAPDGSRLGRQLKKCVPDWRGRQRARHGEAVQSVYYLPDLSACRDAWDAFIGHKSKWE